MRRSILSARQLRTAPDPVDGPGTGGGGGTGTATKEPDKGATGGDDKGFPADTPVADMKPEEQTAYWRHQARKHENAYKGVDIEALKRKAAAHDAAEAEKLTPSEKAIQEAEARGEKAAESRVMERAALSIFRAGLKAREVSDEEITEILDEIKISAYIKDGDVDTDRVHRAVSRLAKESDTGTDSATSSGMGQGRGRERSDTGKANVSDTAAAMNRSLGRRPAKTNQ